MKFAIASLLLLLSHVSAQATPAAYPTGSPLIEIDPPNLTINPDQVNCPIKLRLKRRPTGPVSVYMNANSMGWSSCELKFDANNWDKHQIISAIPLPYMTDSPIDREVEARFQIAALQDPSMNRNELRYKIIRDKGKGAACSSIGDPHYLSFDGVRYDFLTCAGNYYLVKSNFLTIQTQTRKWENGAHTNEAVAIRFGKTVYILHADQGLSCASASREGIQVTQSPNKMDVHFKLADGSEVKAVIMPARIKYIDITVTLAGHAKNQVDGLCGKWTGKGDLKFLGLDNKSYDKAEGPWGQTFKVPGDDNIFVCKDNCKSSATAGYAVKPVNFCQIPVIGDAKLATPYHVTTGYSVAQAIPAYGQGGYKVPPPKIEPPSKPKDATPEHKAKCKKVCETTLIHPLGEKYVKPDMHVINCVQDCILTGGFELVEGNKSSYFTILRTYEKPLMEAARAALDKFNAAKAASTKVVYGRKITTPIPAEIEAEVKRLHTEVHLLRDTFGLGGADCPAKCSGHGACSSSGCMCQKNWTGIKCDYNLAQSGYATPPKPVYATTPYKAPPPVHKPPCQAAILAASEAASNALKSTPGIADALAEGDEGGDAEGGDAPAPQADAQEGGEEQP